MQLALAYKFLPAGAQSEAVFARLPKWATTDLFTVEAKAPMANPSKDQIRMMMQSLLAERFKLAVHFETHDVPVMALVLVEPDKLGYRLRPHSQGPPCDAIIPPVDRSSPKIPDVWRPVCGDFQILDWTNNTVILVSRNTTMVDGANFSPIDSESTGAAVSAIHDEGPQPVQPSLRRGQEPAWRTELRVRAAVRQPHR